MKILIVGDFNSRLYEEAFFNSFKQKGFDVDKFSWWQYFKGYQYGMEKNKNIFKKIYYKFQNKFIVGPIIRKINEDLVETSKNLNPDLIFIYRGTHILTETISKIKNNENLVFGYNNDDPFGKDYPKYFWRNFIKSIKLYDHLFIYRKKNENDLIKFGYNNFSQLRSYYIKEYNYFIPNVSDNRFNTDVLFVGHFEDDGRDEYLKYLIDNGIKIKIFGGDSWKTSKYYDFFIKHNGPICNLGKDDYNLALNCAKICLVFLSKRNNDSYTRRCFEIPAAKSFMLSEYTDDLNSLFKEGKEAAYFYSKEDLLKKISFYLSNQDIRNNIALAGHQRLIVDGHEVSGRIDEIIRVYNNIKNEKNINT